MLLKYSKNTERKEIHKELKKLQKDLRKAIIQFEFITRHIENEKLYQISVKEQVEIIANKLKKLAENVL